MIHLLSALNWFTNKRDFLSSCGDNESAKNAATRLWNSIENGSVIPVVMMLLITGLMCLFYYYPFNNMPGRHYKPRFLVIFGFITIVLNYFLTFIMFQFFIAKSPSVNEIFIAKVAGVNTLYSLLLFCVMSYFVSHSKSNNAYPL